jgi:hypothetical protein
MVAGCVTAAGNVMDQSMIVPQALAILAVLGWIGVEPALMEFTTIDRGDHSQIEEPRQVVVRTAPEWSALWQQHAGAGKPAAVDFTRSMVIAVFVGSRPTAGYTVEITRIETQDAGLVVTYREKGPPPGAMVAQVLTSPFHIVRTPFHGGPVKFQRTP